MRRLKYAGIIFGVVLILSACGNNAGAGTPRVYSPAESDTAQAAEAVSAEAVQMAQPMLETEETGGLSSSDVDVDLTKMSGTMVYSEVYNMLTYPERYVGKTVRVAGEYYASYWEDTDTYYQYVIVADASACCEQGLEFVWDGGIHSYPEDYPKDFTAVEIVGTFTMYEEDGYEYCYLATDAISIQ